MTFAISISNLNENLTIIDNKQFDEKLIPHYFKSHDQSLSHANPQYHPWPHTLNFLTQTVYPSYLVNILYTGVWKHWAGYRTFWPIFTTLVLLPIYFVYSLVSIYRTFTRFIGQCPAWLAVSTPLSLHDHMRMVTSIMWVNVTWCALITVGHSWSEYSPVYLTPNNHHHCSISNLNTTVMITICSYLLFKSI